MEVHHHPEVEKKGFKGYILEGLMIFIAVFMGFIAENIRENIAEKKNARLYLESYRNDLLNNQRQLKKYDKDLKRMLPVYDSIVSIFYHQNENKELPALSRLLLEGQRNFILTINMPTYDQLISSGSMRFIESKDLKDSIANYKYKADQLTNYNDRIVTTVNNDLGEVGKIEDMHDFWNAKKHVHGYTPEMQPFTLTLEQRKFIIGYNKVFTVEVIHSGLIIDELSVSNAALLKLIDNELNK